MDKHADKITDWAEVISDRIVTEVEAIIAYDGRNTKENALECVLSNSCAGPVSVTLAKKKLGIE